MDIPEIEIAELESRLAAGSLLLDVREDDEWATAHIDGATHVALATIPDRLSELSSDTPIYVICARGARSARAVEFLRHQKIEAINVAGGMMAWLDAKKPSISGRA
ncbi:MAG: rhodanese-like domain-containing protein [Acidimicrobiales bacterium]|nr:rhodanese-like domain-containing protein [Acidimicrobiales bacterium]MDG2218802.1 rhodanese-like domain-containing protein [Acidimicrobiales bacterium]